MYIFIYIIYIYLHTYHITNAQICRTLFFFFPAVRPCCQLVSGEIIWLVNVTTMWVLLPKSTKELKEENIPKKKREWNEERKGSRTGVKAQVGCEATCYPFIKRFSNVVWHLRGQCVYHSRTTSTSTSTSPTPTPNTLSQSLSLPARRLFLSYTNTPASLVKVRERERERGRKSANQPQLALTDATNAKLFPLCVCLCAQCFVSVRVCKCACVSQCLCLCMCVCVALTLFVLQADRCSLRQH